jgi:hypothetical protein
VITLAPASARLVPPDVTASRAASLDWQRIAATLDEVGWATTGALLRPEECRDFRAAYRRAALFRRRIDMARHRFGRGEYRYFAYPLPARLGELRADFYAHLAPLANRWQELLGQPKRFPPAHADYLARCHRAGQTRPTPLLLRYEAGDYNRLHQDLYGEHVFPLQVALLLSAPGADFTGGEFVLTEQRARTQSRAHVVPLAQGEGVIFAVNERPVRTARGSYRVHMRHGVSEVRSGERYVLGLVFHDAA